MLRVKVCRLFILLLVFAGGSLRAEGNGSCTPTTVYINVTIRGAVVTGSTPLPGATVTAASVSATTNGSGSYSLTLGTSGDTCYSTPFSVNVCASAAGYNSGCVTLSATIPADPGNQFYSENVGLSPIAASSTPFQAVTGKFTSDNRTDYMLWRLNPHETDVYLSDTNGSFNGRVLSSQDGIAYPSTFAIAVGDFNGDGITDYMLYRLNPHETDVYFGKGDGTFSSRVLSSQDGVAYPAQFQLVTGDFNGDGKTDYMVYSLANDHETNVYLSNGDGTFTPRHLSSQDGVNYPPQFQLVTGDFNGDGKTDYMVYSLANDHESNVYFSKGDGTFSGRVLSSQDGVNYPPQFQMVTGDFNGDGKTDYMVYSLANDHESNVYLSQGNGTFSGRILSSQDGVNYPPQFQLVTGDFNGDGKIDYMIYSLANDHETDVYLNQGNGTFSGRVLSSQDGINYPSYFNILVGDFNGDGISDYLFYDLSPHESDTYLNKGAGLFDPRVETYDGVGY